MVTEHEARRLQHDMKPELNATRAAVWMCAAGLLALVMVVLIGPRTESAHDRDLGSTTARVSMQQQE